MDVKADFHIHSEISPDSDSSMLEMAREALRAGLTEICFTDHYDPGYPNEEDFPGIPDMARYDRAICEAREAVPEITIRSGTEIGMYAPHLADVRAFAEARKFDFVLLSKHLVRGRDPYYPDFFDGMTQREGEEAYLREILSDMISFSDFDVCAHIGYVDRYLRTARNLDKLKPPFVFEDFPDLIDEILLILVKGSKGLEINTSKYPQPGTPLPHPSILRRYRELGGEIITFGSDAHSPGEIAAGFAFARDLAESVGFRYYCTFSGRKPVFQPLS